MLKHLLLSVYKRRERALRAPWLRETDSKQSHQSVQPELLFKQLVEQCVFGWDEVVHGLVGFAFNVIDTQNRGFNAGRDFVRLCALQTGTPGDSLSTLAHELLFELFRTQEMVREDVIGRLLNHLLVKSPNAGAYVQVLHRLVHEFTRGVIPYVPRIRDAVDHICQWGRGNASRFLAAVQPLLRLNGQLRDALFMTLKKGMFSRYVHLRLYSC